MTLARRHFNKLTLLSLLGIGALNMKPTLAAPLVQRLRLKANGGIPNNATLPVLIYPAALAVTGSDPASLFERTFAANGWPPQ